MRRTVYLCHAAADQDLALDLAAFLEVGTGLDMELVEGQIRRGEDLISKVRYGHSSDVELVMLSPDAAPVRWVREEWTAAFWEEPAEAQMHLATVLLRDCKFPELLRRRNFFDLTADRLEGFRQIKQWLVSLASAPAGHRFTPARPAGFIGRNAELDSLRRALADIPGRVTLGGAPGAGKTTLALEFARRFRGDFEEVLWLTCAGRSAAALAGDLAAQLGLRLPGEVAQNVQALQRFLGERRCLAVFDDAEDETLLPPVSGKTSVLLTTRRDSPGCLRIEPVAATSQDVAALSADARRLFAALAACPPGAARLPLAANAASLDEPAALDALAPLRERAMVRPIEDDRYEVHPVLREQVPPEARRNAEAVARAGDATLAEIQHAFAWAVSQDDEPSWNLARSLARAGFQQAQAQDRLAEACEFMELLASRAERHGDRRVLSDCAWERNWILERWGRVEEAQALDRVRRVDYEDQMSLDFGD